MNKKNSHTSFSIWNVIQLLLLSFGAFIVLLIFLFQLVNFRYTLWQLIVDPSTVTLHSYSSIPPVVAWRKKIWPVPSPTPSPMSKYIPPPSPTPWVAPTVMATASAGLSLGVFYPFSDHAVVNNQTPTIIGTISQNDHVYLPTLFGSEISPISTDERIFLRFLPGRTKNLIIKIDQETISNVFGIAQYPTIDCYQAEQSESTCLLAKSKILPPLIFFAKPTYPLSIGRHEVNVVDTQNPDVSYPPMIFFIYPQYSLPPQVLYDATQLKPNNQSTWLFATDNCTEGYYYDKNHLKMPLPDFDNRNLFYSFAFPQNDDEVGNRTSRRVMIRFENFLYELFFPQSNVLYQRIHWEHTNQAPPSIELFLPKDHLVFPDGSAAVSRYLDSKTNTYYEKQARLHEAKLDYSPYLEIFPTDTSGGRYQDFYIPWENSISSSCDG